jgi:hypothetical protein
MVQIPVWYVPALSIKYSVSITCFPLRDGKPVQTFKVGDRVTVRLVVEANRDYE